MNPSFKKLGASKKYARKIPDSHEKMIDTRLGLHAISIRLQKNLIDALKEMARTAGIGYQPYIRQLLTQHVQNKKKHSKNLKVIKR